MADELHVGLIMDGNGRWARMRGLSRSEGHLQARVAIESVANSALDQGVTHLSLFAFSTENWRRSAAEVDLLMQPRRWLMTPSQVAHYRRNRVRVSFVGDRDDPRIPGRCRNWIKGVEEETFCPRPRLSLTVAFNYGGRQEITDAVRRAGADVQQGRPADFRDYLWTRDLPDMDLLIRTSGECRLSNFMLWQLWYAELAFTRTLWPDFRGSDLVAALHDFRKRSRRWGSASGDPGSGVGGCTTEATS